MCSNACVRWDSQRLGAAALPAPDQLAVGQVPGLVRRVQTPDFAGVTFHEVLCKSALNRVPAASTMPFRWTVNPWRGCTHACFYCYARGSHSWLDLDTGYGFDTQVVVKTNIATVLSRELARPTWRRQQVALGTNTDPYQRAEGRYRLMPDIIAALAEAHTPFSLLTKGTLLRRDLPLLQEAARRVPVGLGVSLALADERLQQLLEPGTPSVAARLDLVRAVRAAGLPCGVFVAPVLPHLTDSTAQLDALLARLADAGASGVTVLPLHLRPGAREWFLGWLQQNRPDLLARYRELYDRGAYVSRGYQEQLWRRVRPLLARHGFCSAATRRPSPSPPAEGSFPTGSVPSVPSVTADAQPSLF